MYYPCVIVIWIKVIKSGNVIAYFGLESPMPAAVDLAWEASWFVDVAHQEDFIGWDHHCNWR